jgi:hypothetical protein
MAANRLDVDVEAASDLADGHLLSMPMRDGVEERHGNQPFLLGSRIVRSQDLVLGGKVGAFS